MQVAFRLLVLNVNLTSPTEVCRVTLNLCVYTEPCLGTVLLLPHTNILRLPNKGNVQVSETGWPTCLSALFSSRLTSYRLALSPSRSCRVCWTYLFLCLSG